MPVKYCEMCARWSGDLVEALDECPEHGSMSAGHLATAPELWEQTKKHIASIKMRKKKINEELEFHKLLLEKLWLVK